MRTYSDTELAEYLGGGVIPVDAYSLVGEAPHDLPVFWLPETGFRYLIIEDDELSRASKDFLARRGARRFRDEAEMQATAHSERWATRTCRPVAGGPPGH